MGKLLDMQTFYFYSADVLIEPQGFQSIRCRIIELYLWAIILTIIMGVAITSRCVI